MLPKLKDYFVYSKAERNGFLILLAVIFLLVVLIFVRPLLSSSIESEAREEISFIALTNEFDRRDSIQKVKYKKYKKHQLFFFDPNQAAEEELIDLGFSEKQAHVIIRYREKNPIRNNNDFAKIYVVNEYMFGKLEPYIRIDSTFFKNEKVASQVNDKPIIDLRSKVLFQFDLNTATTEQLDSVPGIGDKLANRIVKFRSKIAGFDSVSQLRNVYGLSEDNFNLMQDYFYLTPFQIESININQVSFKELLSHPYFDYNLTKSVINLRGKIGKFENEDDLKILTIFNDSLLNKVRPYINYQ